MAAVTYQFSFSDQIPFHEVEESLLLALIATESVHGRSSVKLEASFKIHEQKRLCVIDAETEVGRHIARIFTGYLTQQFGEEAFKVKQLERDQKCVVEDDAE